MEMTSLLLAASPVFLQTQEQNSVCEQHGVSLSCKALTKEHTFDRTHSVAMVADLIGNTLISEWMTCMTSELV